MSVSHKIVIILFLFFLASSFRIDAKENEHLETAIKPNIIWIVLEDISNDLGSYGNEIIKTPNLDKLASEGTQYSNAFATSPVCSPSRSAFFTGMYQTSIGVHNHRSHADDGYQLPEQVKLISDYLREENYYTILMGPKQKTDFNFHPRVEPFDAMDGEMKSSGGAYTHGPVDESILDKPAWKKYKKEGEGKPFFAQINYSESHRTFIHDEENSIDPTLVKIPSYYPDHDITRRDWALYLETIQWLDKKIGNLFKELENENVLDNTVVFIFGDHGAPMLRGKQWLYDSGIQVPFILWGKGIEQGKVTNQLVSLIDIVPTTMKLAGVDVPEYIEGQSFLGNKPSEREYVYAQRDRLGATEDRIRAIRSKQFKYILNYYPNLSYSNFSAYKKIQYPVLTLMEYLHEKNQLTPIQGTYR